MCECVRTIYIEDRSLGMILEKNEMKRNIFFDSKENKSKSYLNVIGSFPKGFFTEKSL